MGKQRSNFEEETCTVKALLYLWSFLATKINGSTLPPPVDQNTNKTTIAPNKETMLEDAISKDHLNVSKARGSLMSDIKKCQGGACLQPVNEDILNSDALENTTKIVDLRKTETPDLSSNSSKTSSSKNITESPVDHLNVSDARANLMDDIKSCAGGKCLKSTHSGNKNSTTTQKKVVPSLSPVKDISGDQKVYMCECVKFHGWSFFGGIVVTILTAAIAFVGIKYYKTKKIQNQNYNLM